MRSILTLATAAAVLSITSLSTASAQPAGTMTVTVKQCLVEQIPNGYRSTNCNASELRVFLAVQGIQTSAPAVQVAQAPTWAQAQAPAPYDHPLAKVNYQDTCEPTAAGGRTCYGHIPGPNALEWVAVLGGLTTRVIYATRHNYRW